MTYTEAEKYIEELEQYGSVPGLDNIRNLCGKLGNPQEHLKFVHIAGTNGKGSVLAYVSSILKAAGYRVGRFLSPTLLSYRERIQVNGRPITQAALCGCLERIRTAIGELLLEGKPHPTLFEVETAAAFLYFVDMHCDIVVLETGLGGLLDATNVVENTLAAVFTSISMDHMAVLGDTLEKIAVQKSGIIKNGCYVISAPQRKVAADVLRKRAAELGCPYSAVCPEDITAVRYGVERQSFTYAGLEKLEIRLAGLYQIENAALAVETIRALEKAGFHVTPAGVRKGLQETDWPGRFSVIQTKPYFLVDGAHNVDAAGQLSKSLSFYFTNKRIIYIMGVLRDKDYPGIIRETCGLACHILTITPPGNKRALPAYELARAVVEQCQVSVTAVDSLEEAVEMSRLLADKDAVTVAFGSLSYLGDLIRILRKGKHT